MIPQIPQAPGIAPLVLDFLAALTEHGFTGDTATRYADRLIMSTDNSLYQSLPDAVVFPRSTADVVLIARLAGEQRFISLQFVPRGGGTGTNGQSLNQGIVVDMSRHMNRILNINLEEKWVQVEAGVIKDELNAYLRPFGYFFAPELSTSNRATIGGMINTDASGQGSMVYGKTSDHVPGLRAVLLGGDILDTCAIPVAQADRLAQAQTPGGIIYRTVIDRCYAQRDLILEKFPRLNRFLTGYDLRHVLSDDLQSVDLTRILCGSEGTLAFITEARLAITPLPKIRRLVNIKYDSFDSALRNAPFLVKAKALSVETIDAKVLNLAREDIIWHSVKALISRVPDKEMQGLNIVEFAGDDTVLIDKQVSALCEQLAGLMSAGKGGIIGYQLCHDLAEIERIYLMRKKAVGLLGNAKGDAKPVPFVEDTCVPPEHLADYISEFRALLDGYGLDYGMFGHVDAGVLHVRPALDMCDPQQEKLIRQISDDVVVLTRRYGGVLWGEHGKGFRAEYSPAFFGDVLYGELRRIKAAFDPANQLNPGKICTPWGMEAEMKQINATKRGHYDRQIPITIRKEWRGAMECNGNGLCFNVETHSPMCPSMKITHNRIHSPKGRATLIREWLRLLAERGTELTTIEKSLSKKGFDLRDLFVRTRNSWRAKRGEYDFSHEVNEAMSGCLACKACSVQCPVKIDVPGFRARFLQLYHTRYLRPIGDYMVAGVESYAPLMASVPKAVNFVLRQGWIRRLTHQYMGMVDVPLFSSPSLKQRLSGRCMEMSLEHLESLSDAAREKIVLVVQDPFTSYYEAQLICDFVQLIEKLEFQPVLLPFSPNGKAQHVKGFLQRFASTARQTADFLNRVAKLALPLVGVDPALVLCYRHEYREILGASRGDFHVMLVHEWLQQVLSADQPIQAESQHDAVWYLFGHCTESTALPSVSQHWQAIFAHFGARLENVSVGCCGMAGTYGHETSNLENSLGIYALSWQQMLKKLPHQRCLATGYSCRSQVKRVEGLGLRHPLQALLTLL
ncbi:FAD-binding and (Fe-S)-binding domain-containing protein [Enterobacteriaceae bacterium LUAb1]